MPTERPVTAGRRTGRSRCGFACALEFCTATSGFVRGLEVGWLWEILKQTRESIQEVVHASYAEMVLHCQGRLKVDPFAPVEN